MKLKKVLPVAAATVIAPLLVIWLTPYNPFGVIWSGITWFVRLFIIKVSLPIWLIIILILAISVLSRGASFSFTADGDSAGTYLNYTSDKFFGILWRWKYTANKLYDEHIVPRCPSCMTLLRATEETSYRMIDEVTLTCPNCDFKRRFEYSLDDLLDRIRREIDRKIVTDEYKTVKE